MKTLADTGFIAKLNLKEPNTSHALALLSRLTPPLALTERHLLELSNAFQRAVFTGAVTAAQAAQMQAHFEADVRTGIFAIERVDFQVVLTAARKLTHKHTPVIGTRSLDLLHVACAVELGATVFVSFDQRQCLAAKAEGLHVLP